jgi:hypothetical protein
MVPIMGFPHGRARVRTVGEFLAQESPTTPPDLFTCLTDLAALFTLHQLLVVKALRIQGAWSHAIEYPGNHPAHLGGGGTQEKGAPWMGPNIRPGAQAGCLVLGPGGSGRGVLCAEGYLEIGFGIFDPWNFFWFLTV